FASTASTQFATLSLHDALPISRAERGHLPDRSGPAARTLRGRRLRLPLSGGRQQHRTGPRPEPSRRDPDRAAAVVSCTLPRTPPDRKSTRLNSSHVKISYAVFC